jgi:hypothetical protein
MGTLNLRAIEVCSTAFRGIEDGMKLSTSYFLGSHRAHIRMIIIMMGIIAYESRLWKLVLGYDWLQYTSVQSCHAIKVL